MAPGTTFHSFKEIEKHSHNKDCWLTISGKVYNVSQFMLEHPGGPEVLLATSGRDGKKDFDDVGHSKSAKEQMNQYYIGEVDPDTVPYKRFFVPPKEGHQKSMTTTELLIRILQLLVPLLILGWAFAARVYMKSD